ncbi:YecA family protein [Paenibacillus tuaregi]|uniref:YecA family protein n=1 Tax=Paenibacillus tuaregi TaxID=1816681 RepID=UPI00083919A4|nr:SEC-C metal-binding domain-containing protein [Paenibacillus tuaregi]
MDILAIKDYLHNFRGTVLNEDIPTHLKSLKAIEVSQNNQSAAKEIWCIEQVYKVIRGYLSAFRNLQEKKHFDAWLAFDRTDIELSFLRKHLDFQDNNFHLPFYDKMIFQYQKLFPYQYFMSREMIVKRASCSICGATVSLRRPCGHRIGEIYNGEQCGRIIQDAEFLAIAIVTNPFDKYTVLFPQGMEYNYSMLDTLLTQISGPYDDWNLDFLKERKKEFIGVGRNQLCPCNSGKKYKMCCHGTDNELFDHHRITVQTSTPRNNIPMFSVHTWK